MALTYRIDPDAQMLCIAGEGIITQVDRVWMMHAWWNDPAFKPSLDTFCDFSAAESTPTMSELREVIALMGQHSDKLGPKKLAIVTAKPVTFGVARVFQTIAAEGLPLLEVRVFYDREEARAWLRPAATP